MLGLVFAISSTSLLHSTIIISFSMAAVRNYPGMSTTATSLLVCVSITDVISSNSNATVVYVAPFFWDPYCYFRLSLNACPLTFPLRFSLSNISDSRESSFYFLLVFATFLGAKVLFVCSWFSSFSNTISPTFLFLFSPFLINYSVITYCTIC